MKESLCAHCNNCGEVKYDGFLCDCTGYIENQTTSTGCDMFEDDGFVYEPSKPRYKEETPSPCCGDCTYYDECVTGDPNITPNITQQSAVCDRFDDWRRDN